MTAATIAFDREAPGYDEGFGRNPAGLVFRHAFQERLRALFAPGARVVDLGCGTGEDALFLASLGVRVHAVDLSPAMVERTRAKAARAGLAERVTASVLAAESVASLGDGFDGAYSDFGALNCTALGTVGEGLARVLRPGAPLLLSVIGPWPLPALVGRALFASGPFRRPVPDVGGVPVPIRHLTPAALRQSLGPAFAWTDAWAQGVLLPGPMHERWIRRHPLAFGVMAAAERAVRRWPGLRSLGDHAVVEGYRR
ncbi:MAG: class I SAM-dependent methyltransferase [Vicinamibacteria bacterium]